MSSPGIQAIRPVTFLVLRAIQAITIVASGMFAGVMLFIGNSLGGFWQSLDARNFLNWFVTNNGFIQDTIPMVSLPTLLGSLLCSILCWRLPSRRWWLATTLCWSGVAVLTFGFFVPMNAAFASGQIQAADVTSTLAFWLQVHWARVILGITGTTFAYLAVSRV
ncbi:hypothetical protein IWQ51_005940 [Labrenzia sp. EL_142]|nr:hypothetical protein [Labrenzia sp. EL_142]MBG6211190.1 hypothetical protein [Labrenzia sp. EL_126]